MQEHPREHLQRRANKMLRWAVIFLIVALVAAVLGFGSIAGASASIAVTLFWVFLVVTLVLFVMSLFGRRPVV